jgi:hypothetical protein
MFGALVFRRVATGRRSLAVVVFIAALLLAKEPVIEVVTQPPRSQRSFVPYPILFGGPVIILPLAWERFVRD